MLEVRVAEPDDWEVVRALRLRALRESPEAFRARYDDEAALTEQQWRDRLGQARTIHAFVEERPVGRVVAVDAGGHPRRVALVGMWVDPQSRGAGVGGALVEAVCRFAMTQGARQVDLSVEEQNTAARRFYERSGFALTGGREPLPDVRRVHLAMSRQLKRP